MRKKLFNKFTALGMTDVGHIRDHNEDSLLINEELNLLLVADGMGGHDAGEVASMEAINIIQKMLDMQLRTINKQKGFFQFFNKSGEETLEVKDKVNSLEKALHQANNHIFQLNVERNAFDGTGMGTTIAGCWLISEDVMLVFHIGDSRVYRFRNNKLELLTSDHSMLQKWHDNGCIGEKPRSNVILNAVGPYPTVVPEIQVVPIMNADAFLICSDGLTDMVDDSEIQSKLQGLQTEKIEKVCQSLLELALEYGGKDNISALLMFQDCKS